jgi:hypothetical protein
MCHAYVRYNAQQTICSQGEEALGLFVIVEGSVAVHRLPQKQQQQQQQQQQHQHQQQQQHHHQQQHTSSSSSSFALPFDAAAEAPPLHEQGFVQ